MAYGPEVSDTGSVQRKARRFTAAGSEALDEVVAEERAVALVYNGVSHAVMMATPRDLEDFARGFSITEGIVQKASEIYDVEVEPVGRGFEVQLRIANQRMAVLQERRRSLAGRTGCGLCGVESLDAALRPVAVTRGTATVSRAAVERAMAELPSHQLINKVNGATHAAGWSDMSGKLLSVREDVGRHNALDKLAGALAELERKTPGSVQPGFVVVTSRCSYEMVQKAAAIDAAAIAAVSAPTSLAIETAEQANLALLAFVRGGRLTAYAHEERLTP